VLRDTFRRARLANPSIIFLDEADALAPRRQEGSGSDQGSGGGPDAGLRLLSTLLTEIDGLEETQGGWGWRWRWRGRGLLLLMDCLRTHGVVWCGNSCCLVAYVSALLSVCTCAYV
jgi:SpoVK/Ycf46/Vps4 family AAA+-type ATPase